MSNNIKIVSRLSRKAKINISIVIFLIFIAVAVLTSINQVKDIVERREELVELKERLNWYRNENIRLLAQEKSLYEEEAIELEARKQFNMTTGEETNVSVIVEDNTTEEDSGIGAESRKESYQDYGLWENMRIFYYNEIGNN
ncbi:MAG: cell division protein FtsL [Actinomycetota bacterium]|nr:cell division protein FtsL [Actinomycetota bacterium]